MSSQYENYALRTGDDIGDPRVLNARWRDLDLRLVRLEDVEKDWTRSLSELTTLGIARIDEVLRPAYQEVHDLASLGAIFQARSDTLLGVEVGLKRFTIAEDDRNTFAPAAYMAAFVEADPGKAMLGHVQGYDRESGVLELVVDRAAGEGSAAGWLLYPAALSDTATDREEIAVMKDAVNGYRTQAEGFALSAAADAATATTMRNSAVAANTAAGAAKDAAVAAKNETVSAIAFWTGAVLPPAEADPDTRPGGAPLQPSDQYFNTVIGAWKTWDGSAFVVNMVPVGSEVLTVHGRTGNVVAVAGDYSGDQVGRTAGQQASLAGPTVEAALITLKDQVAAEATARTAADGAKADKATTVTGGGLATGGGDLSANRTIMVTETTQADAQAGTGSTGAMTARRTKDAIDALVPAASTTVAGKVQLATGAEGTTGTSTTKVPPVAVVKAMVDAAITALVGGSPATLDAINELAAAIGNDPNFSTTVAASIATKLNASAVSAFMLTLLDDADQASARTTLGASALGHGHAQSEITGLVAALAAKLDAAGYTAADVLAKLLTVDGSGSGLDADKLRGTTPSAFGLARMGDADQAAARSGLGLGTAALAALTALVQTSGDQTVAGVKTFSSIPVGPAADPTTADQLARKGYVDNKVAAITSGQPIPTSSSDYGVGSVLFLILVTSGASVANNATVAGSALRIQGSVSDDWTVNYDPGLSGTWKNISGGTIGYTRTGYFVRTA